MASVRSPGARVSPNWSKRGPALKSAAMPRTQRATVRAKKMYEARGENFMPESRAGRVGGCGQNWASDPLERHRPSETAHSITLSNDGFWSQKAFRTSILTLN